MKKTNTLKNWMSLLSFCFVFLASLVTTNSSATTYQVGTGTATSTLRPIYSCYGYNYMQQIYTAAELNTAGASGAQVISQIRFFYATAAATPANYNN